MEMCKVLVVLVAVVSCQMTTSSGYSLNSLSQRVDRLEGLLTGDVIPGSSANESSVIKDKSCPSDFYLHKATSSCYRIMDESKSWYEAREDCQAQGADLIWYETPYSPQRMRRSLHSLYITATTSKRWTKIVNNAEVTEVAVIRQEVMS